MTSSPAWSGDLQITDVNPDARTFTAELDGLMPITQMSPWLADHITITWHIPDLDIDGNPVDQPYMQVGQTIHLNSRRR